MMILKAIAIGSLIAIAAGSMMRKRRHCNTGQRKNSRFSFLHKTRVLQSTASQKVSSRSTVQETADSKSESRVKDVGTPTRKYSPRGTKKPVEPTQPSRRFLKPRNSDREKAGLQKNVMANTETSMMTDLAVRKEKALMLNNLFEMGAMKNYNRDTDITREMQRKAAEENIPFLKAIKVTETAMGLDIGDLFQSKLTDTREQGRSYYPASCFAMKPLLGYLANASGSRDMDRILNTQTAIGNLAALCNATDMQESPCYTSINNFLEKQDSDIWREMNYTFVKGLISADRYYPHRFMGRVPMILDATGFATFPERHCPNCLKMKQGTDDKGNPTYIYQHKVLVAKIILAPNIVITLDMEFIENESIKDSKQGCETNAAKKMLRRIREKFPRLPLLLQGDSLYTTGPMMDLCKELRIEYMTTFKEGNGKARWAAFAELPEEELNIKDVLIDGQHCKISWYNGLNHLLEGDDADRSMNVLQAVFDVEMADDGDVHRIVRPSDTLGKGRRVEIKEMDSTAEGGEKEKEKKDARINKKGTKKGGSTPAAEDKGTLTKDEALVQNAYEKAVEILEGEKGVGLKKRKGVGGKECEASVHEVIKDGKVVKIVRLTFTWICSFEITENNCKVSVQQGRKRWKVETSFYLQKRVIFNIEHLRALGPNAMKAHLWLMQYAEMILFLFYAYDEAVQVYGKNLTYFMQIMRECIRNTCLKDYEEEYRKPMRLFNKAV